MTLAEAKYEKFMDHWQDSQSTAEPCCSMESGATEPSLCYEGKLLFSDWQEQLATDLIFVMPQKAYIVTVTANGRTVSKVVDSDVEWIETPLGTVSVEDNRGSTWERSEIKPDLTAIWRKKVAA